VTDEPFSHVLPKQSPRHVPRARLTTALDDARAQSIVLYAPAGYGKTSLALEWLSERDDAAWFTAQPDAGDVGAAVMGVGLAASSIVPGAADRIRQRISIVEEPAQAARTLAEILAEDLADWPSGGIIAVDDYHHLAQSDAAESFIDWLLVLRPSLRLLTATRRRPSWASARRVLAGDILELDKRVLAMTDTEVAEVLGPAQAGRNDALVEKAEGWPAVIGLAALSNPGWENGTDLAVTDDVFRYFAEELLRTMTFDERKLLLVVSVPRSITTDQARELAGDEAAPLLEQLRARGLLTEAAEGSFKFHPLVRDFLLKEFRAIDGPKMGQISEQLRKRARAERRWEDAFDASLMLGSHAVSAEIASEAASDLIRTGRIETLERWLSVCVDESTDSADAMLIRATLAFHAGRFASARSMALDAHRMADGKRNARALHLAGQATHLLGDCGEALELHLRAKAVARSTNERVEALAGAVAAAAELEQRQAVELTEELDREAPATLENRLRSFTRWTLVGDRMGSLERAERMLRALGPVDEHAISPAIQSGYFSMAAHVLSAQARAVEAIGLTKRGIEYCERFRLPWAATWMRLEKIRPLVLLGKTAEARSLLTTLEAPIADGEASGPRLAYQAACVQLLLLEGRIDDAANLVLPAPTEIDSRALGTEARALQAIALALSGNSEAARSTARSALEITGAVETTCYAGLALGLADQIELAPETISAQLERAAIDAAERYFVEAYAFVARLHKPLADWGHSNPTLAGALARIGLVGKPMLLSPDIDSPISPAMTGLTRREIEVLSLVAQGMSNAEIADTLVVAVSTVKAHVHHILAKLNVRSRAAAAHVFHEARHDEASSGGHHAADDSVTSSTG
jgi:ATP/maltotriose-dependent transcriptional regulator MalT